MKNIHILPTDKPSRLAIENRELILVNNTGNYRNAQHIYITNDEEIKEGDAYITKQGEICKSHNGSSIILFKTDKKIILTTDPDLIKNGVQAIDDEFLEWFVNNPSCERVVVNQEFNPKNIVYGINTNPYKIIIPKEEPNYNMKQEILAEMERLEEEPKHILYTGKVWEPPKQETLEEAAERIFTPNYIFYKVRRQGFVEGAKWQAERMYSEEDMIEFHKWAFQKNRIEESDKTTKELLLEWFEQFKKKI